ncbi:tetratricopeptide repeat protein [Mangrovivirga sp. M17]|uniref:Tetratricopeptide repeat protein n=1 Tax=Mangrovivirga halotolerans TaxID=2993936 RepID=A0ABT3RNM5_9BACT|nr:tetratricopeptide repeat protein [Mangrovivirga halotolerans]MCX2743076.1 tetratricopeptide repeat protein [Mangrovivirga halotolerans]
MRELIFLYICLFNSTLFCFAQGNQEEKIDSLQSVLSSDISADERINTLIYLGVHYQSTSLDTSIMYGQTALEISENTSDSLKARIYDLLGTAYNYKGLYDKSIENLIEGLRYAEKMGNPVYEATFLVNIGTVHDRQSSFDKAEEYYQKAVDVIELADKKIPEGFPRKLIFLANINNNLANIYGNRGDTTMMLDYYDKALVHARAVNDEQLISIILNNVGNTYLYQGDFDRAYENLNSALKIRRKLKGFKSLAQSYRNLGFYHFKSGNPDSAILYFNKSIDAAKKVGSLKEHVDSKEGLAKVFESIGQTEKALDEFKEYKQLNDSLYNERRVSELAKIESQYLYDKEQLKSEAEQKRREFRMYLIVGALVAIVVILTLLTLFQRNRVRAARLKAETLELRQKSWDLEKKNLSMELEHKNKEMSTKLLYLFKKNELIDDVIKELKDLVKDLKSENKPILRKVIKNLGVALNEDSWKEFELRFTEVHQEFYNSLESKYPHLTPNERRLCAFLKLNMTSKEISSLTGQSIRSIDVARTRLRKKFGLTNSDVNLVEFLSAI